MTPALFASFGCLRAIRVGPALFAPFAPFGDAKPSGGYPGTGGRLGPPPRPPVTHTYKAATAPVAR
jgi:hypothetical protein